MKEKLFSARRVLSKCEEMNVLIGECLRLQTDLGPDDVPMDIARAIRLYCDKVKYLHLLKKRKNIEDFGDNHHFKIRMSSILDNCRQIEI